MVQKWGCNGLELGQFNLNYKLKLIRVSSVIVLNLPMTNWFHLGIWVMPRPDRARISGPKGPEILVYEIFFSFKLSFTEIYFSLFLYYFKKTYLRISEFRWSHSFPRVYRLIQKNIFNTDWFRAAKKYFNMSISEPYKEERQGYLWRPTIW